MIEIMNPAWLSLAVDNGRYGYAGIGVPPSSALDKYALTALNYLLGNGPRSPAIEVMGNDFLIRIEADVSCAVTGARVAISLNDGPVNPWTTFTATKGSVLRVRQATEGFRYYFGVSAAFGFEKAMGSFTTNLECLFGGHKGRPLIKGDRIELTDVRRVDDGITMPEDQIPSMNPPHILRITEGFEMTSFTSGSLKRQFEKNPVSWYTVSTKSNRTGLRLEGDPLAFRKDAEKSIISEGILPGTVQIPEDGLPIITLYERTIGGYARMGMVIKADLHLLAHLKPKDKVGFELVSMEEAEQLWKSRKESFPLCAKPNQEG